MNFDELSELMAEPPGGDNHGRKRRGGGWHTLESTEASVFLGGDLYVIENPEDRRRTRPNKTWDTIVHGTASAYQNDCRHHPDGPCDACRAAWAAYKRKRRNGQ